MDTTHIPSSMQSPGRPAPTAIPSGTVVIELEAAGVGVPTINRVKMLLKYALRMHGLRCVRCDLPKAETVEQGAKNEKISEDFARLAAMERQRGQVE